MCSPPRFAVYVIIIIVKDSNVKCFSKNIDLASKGCYTKFVNKEVKDLSTESNFACNARIKTVRERVGLTQRAFAERIGISGPAVAKIETNERNPSEQTLRMICNEFGISRAWLEDGIEPMCAVSSDDDIEIITRAMEGTSENKKKLIRLLAEMPDELLDQMMDYLRSKF